MSNSSILGEAKKWSEIPALLAQYNQTVGPEGLTNFFGYASLIKSHNDIKPEASRDVPNQQARLNGVVMTLNVLAHGENALRGSSGKYIDDKGVERFFSNTGLYAGLEPSSDGHTDGMIITVTPEDRAKAWFGFMKRELAEPPQGVTHEAIINGDALETLSVLQDSPEDKLGMYTLLMVTAETDKGLVPAIAVATNEDSPFARIGLTPMQAAHFVLDGQGYHREINNKMMGGSALDYLKLVLTSIRELGFRHERLEAIAVAVEQYAEAIERAHGILELDIGDAFKSQKIDMLGTAYPGYADIVSINPHLMQQEKRPPIPAEVVAKQQKQFARTAEEKAERIIRLRKNGDLKLTL